MMNMEKEQSVLPLRKKEWIPTPLPVVYLGARGEMVRLPFIDTTKLHNVFGVAVENVCYCAMVMRNSCEPASIYNHGFIGVKTKLKAMREKYYPSAKNTVGRIFTAESVYARYFEVPTLDILQKAYMQRKAFDATLRILQENGIDVDLWADGDFICQNSNYPSIRFDNVVDFGTGIVKEYVAPEQNNGKIMQARSAALINDYDPPYPVVNGVFNWKIWCNECETVFNRK